MSVSSFIERSLELDDPDLLFQSYLYALSEFGIDRVLYSALRNTPQADTTVPGISHCYPEDWIAHYVANDYVGLDPVRQYGMCTRHAFTWDHMLTTSDLAPRQTLLMHEAEDAGLKNGVALAFHGPLGEVYGVGMASSENNPDVERHLKSIEVMSTQFHVLFSSLYERDCVVSGSQLTPREREIIKWCAVGKSNWAISQILGISEHGVDFHIRNILRKLDADTRVTAVVKALHYGMIAL